MHGINSGYTGYFNRKYGRAGHLFQGRYKGILVEKDAYLLELSRYLHLNPIRAGMLTSPERYKWSSYPGYVWKGKEVPWVEYVWVLSQFGSDRGRSKKKYREFVSRGLQETNNNPFNDLYGQVILGREAFIEKTKGLLKGKEVSQEIVERKRLRDHPRPEDILSAVTSKFGAGIDILKGKGARNNTAKKMAIYLIKRYSGLGNQEIGELFGGMHYSAVSKSSAKLEREMAEDRNLRNLVEDLVSHVKS